MARNCWTNLFDEGCKSSTTKSALQGEVTADRLQHEFRVSCKGGMWFEMEVPDCGGSRKGRGCQLFRERDSQVEALQGQE